MVYRGSRAEKKGEERRRERRGEERRRGSREIGRQGDKETGKQGEAETNQETNTGVCPLFGAGSKKLPRRNFGHNGSTIKVRAQPLVDTEIKSREAFG